jgi:hypothetical protein
MLDCESSADTKGSGEGDETERQRHCGSFLGARRSKYLHGPERKAGIFSLGRRRSVTSQ